MVCSAEVASAAELKLSLEKGSDEAKLDALRRLIIGTLNGQSHPSLLVRAHLRSITLTRMDGHHPLCAA